MKERRCIPPEKKKSKVWQKTHGKKKSKEGGKYAVIWRDTSDLNLWTQYETEQEYAVGLVIKQNNTAHTTHRTRIRSR